jgi:hypothetical protein
VQRTSVAGSTTPVRLTATNDKEDWRIAPEIELDPQTGDPLSGELIRARRCRCEQPVTDTDDGETTCIWCGCEPAIRLPAAVNGHAHPAVRLVIR